MPRRIRLQLRMLRGEVHGALAPAAKCVCLVDFAAHALAMLVASPRSDAVKERRLQPLE